jgi:hypothetical protein
VVDTRSEPGRIYPVYGKCWPYARAVPSAVWVEYTCGYGEETSPEDLAAERGAVSEEVVPAVLITLRDWYDGGDDGALPRRAEAVLWPLRVFGVYP